MWAAKEGHLSVVQHLHSVGADIESKDQVGLFVFSMYTVCMYACVYINASDSYQTAIHLF